jgi:hypothetical protein
MNKQLAQFGLQHIQILKLLRNIHRIHGIGFIRYRSIIRFYIFYVKSSVFLKRNLWELCIGALHIFHKYFIGIYKINYRILKEIKTTRIITMTT